MGVTPTLKRVCIFYVELISTTTGLRLIKTPIYAVCFKNCFAENTERTI